MDVWQHGHDLGHADHVGAARLARRQGNAALRKPVKRQGVRMAMSSGGNGYLLGAILARDGSFGWQWLFAIWTRRSWTLSVIVWLGGVTRHARCRRVKAEAAQLAAVADWHAMIGRAGVCSHARPHH